MMRGERLALLPCQLAKPFQDPGDQKTSICQDSKCSHPRPAALRCKHRSLGHVLALSRIPLCKAMARPNCTFSCITQLSHRMWDLGIKLQQVCSSLSKCRSRIQWYGTVGLSASMCIGDGKVLPQYCNVYYVQTQRHSGPHDDGIFCERMTLS